MTGSGDGTGATSRRSFLRAGALLAGASALASTSALGGCSKKGEANAAPAPKGSVTTSGGPEVKSLRMGLIALTDCAPLVVALEKGFFKEQGLDVTLTKAASWAAMRDSLSNGDIHGCHMLLGMPIASTMGLLGSPKKPMVIPWLLNRNGQAITLKSAWKGKVGKSAAALKPFVDEAKAANSPLSFAMTFPPGTHAMWMRYWLASGGIHPDKDVSLPTVPPAQMVANMKVGKMDGFCVGEPWGARAIADGIGYTALATQELWEDHPEKVCAFTADFANANPKTVKAVVRALYRASMWLADQSHMDEAVQYIAKPAYVNCEREIIKGRLLGQYDYGDGRTAVHDHAMTFFKPGINYPQPKYAVWWLTQFRRWGMVEGKPDYEGIAASVMRPDLYVEALKELSVPVTDRDDSPVKFALDGNTFEPARAEEYATAFAIHALRG